MIAVTDVLEIKRAIHLHPELSGEERDTSARISDFFEGLSGYTVHQNLGFHGLIASKTFGQGAHIGFRAELDALPISESKSNREVSSRDGRAHLCGHDGHMAILLQTALMLEETENAAGRVSFIFQSAEETGQGAEAMIADERWAKLKPEVLYALHNIPGAELGKVLTRSGSFACASAGMIAKITGKTAHAAHPEAAINPLKIAAKWAIEIEADAQMVCQGRFALATPISLQSGGPHFGTSPAEAELMVTLRATTDDDLARLRERAYSKAAEMEREFQAWVSLSFVEEFAATQNTASIEVLERACQDLDVPFAILKEHFRWSEDFGQFSNHCHTLMFGIGSGLDNAQLHAPDFWFDDTLIIKGSAIFHQLYLANQ